MLHPKHETPLSERQNEQVEHNVYSPKIIKQKNKNMNHFDYSDSRQIIYNDKMSPTRETLSNEEEFFTEKMGEKT
jgi:mRNA-degrading endonuclease HigB of HigAB toxin-antitoxin module